MVKNNGLVRLALLAAVVVIIVLVVYIWNIKSSSPAELKNDSGASDVNYVDLNELMGDNNTEAPAAEVTEVAEMTKEEKEQEADSASAVEEGHSLPPKENKEPVQPEQEMKTITVKEGDTVSFPNLKATDADNDKIKWSFSEPLDKDGTWETKKGDAGTYVVSITASDGQASTTQKVQIIVQASNNLPVIDIANSFDYKEGDTIELNPVITDADKDPLEITYSGFMDSNKKELSYNDAGEHTVTITVSDGKDKVTKKIRINVANVNRAPVITNII